MKMKIQSLPGLVLFTVPFLLDLVSAAPTKTQLQPRSFKIERHRVKSRHKDPLRALNKAHAKYNIAFGGAAPIAKEVTGGGSGEETGRVTNTPTENNVEFLSPVQIGGQTLMLNFDTGSADL